MTITLRAGAFACEVEPALGGSLLSLTQRGQDLLRQAPAGTTNVLEAACFPLVPFANRIAHGRFRFEGENIVLPPDPAALPHAHHGQGWRGAWQIARQTEDCATLVFAHAPGDWPWRYEATQTILLDETGISLTLELANRDHRVMPAGLGLHPFFPRGLETAIVTTAHRMVTTGPDDIPDGEAAFEPGPRSLAALEGLDNLLLGGGDAIAFEDGPGSVRLAASGPLAGWHCYVPLGKDFFCIEPVTHRPDSFRDQRSSERLEPGGSCRLALRIEPSA